MYLSTYFLLFTKRQISKIVIVEICLICNLHRDWGLGTGTGGEKCKVGISEGWKCGARLTDYRNTSQG